MDFLDAREKGGQRCLRCEIRACERLESVVRVVVDGHLNNGLIRFAHRPSALWSTRTQETRDWIVVLVRLPSWSLQADVSISHHDQIRIVALLPRTCQIAICCFIRLYQTRSHLVTQHLPKHTSTLPVSIIPPSLHRLLPRPKRLRQPPSNTPTTIPRTRLARTARVPTIPAIRGGFARRRALGGGRGGLRLAIRGTRGRRWRRWRRGLDHVLLEVGARGPTGGRLVEARGEPPT